MTAIDVDSEHIANLKCEVKNIMPYTIDNPPDAIKELPKHAIEIFVSAFNAAFKQYNGDDSKASATAWAAVKTKYKKEGNKWVTKEAVHPHGEHVCICSDCGKKITVDAGAKCNEQKCPDCGGSMTAETAGEYRNKESDMKEKLKSKQFEIMQEVGKRNASADSVRIKKIIELCQELLSSENVEEPKVKEAVKEADSVLAWLKEQEIAKTEDGVKFPASAFAYIPDSEKPSTWKLRLWEDIEKKVTRRQLGAAAAALSPGGFRGQKADIPKEDLAAVKRRIRAEYRKLEVEDEDIPKWVQESSERTMLINFEPLTEANISKGIAEIVVIRPGFNASKERYYPAEVLARDYKVFEGLKMYADHPTEDEDKNRPERSIKDWVATLKNVFVNEKNEIRGQAHIVESWLKEKLAALRDKGMLSEMGVSINAVGTAVKGEIDGVKTNIIERFVRGRSVDFVTEAGAGGTIEMYEADKTDVDLITLDLFKEHRPDLVKQLESAVRAEITKEVKSKMELEEKLKELETNIETITKERDNLKGKITESEKAQRKAEAKSKIDEAISKSDLPEPSKVRLQERFKDAEMPDGIEEAIKSEADYVRSLSEVKVKNMGGAKPDPTKAKEALRESFKKANPDWTDAQLDVAVQGR